MNDQLEKNKILEACDFLSDVKVFASSESTQKDAKILDQDRCLYLADHQLSPYGRFGRQYYAVNGSGIYMSLCLHLPHSQDENFFVSTDKTPQYTILMGAALVLAIEKLTTKKPMIKWVNDIYLDGKKMAGILTEASVSTDRTQIIIGVGLNFSISSFPYALKDKATSLFDTEPTLTRNALIAEIWNQFDRLLREDSYFDCYKSHSFILGKHVEFTQNHITYDGYATDLTPQGELVVRLSDGSTRILSSGEISLKKWTS